MSLNFLFALWTKQHNKELYNILKHTISHSLSFNAVPRISEIHSAKDLDAILPRYQGALVFVDASKKHWLREIQDILTENIMPYIVIVAESIESIPFQLFQHEHIEVVHKALLTPIQLQILAKKAEAYFAKRQTINVEDDCFLDVRSHGKLVRIYLHEIVYCKASDNYAVIYQEVYEKSGMEIKEHIISKTLSDVEQIIQQKLLRVSRSIMVNLRAIREVNYDCSCIYLKEAYHKHIESFDVTGTFRLRVAQRLVNAQFVPSNYFSKSLTKKLFS